MTRRGRRGRELLSDMRIVSSRIAVGTLPEQPSEGSEATPTRYGTDGDPILPVRIRHDVDEIRDGETVQEYYNYLVYEFEVEGVRAHARAYLDEPGTVSIFGPYKATDVQADVDAPAFLESILDYLKRRYMRIDRFSKKEPVGYHTIWPLPGA